MTASSSRSLIALRVLFCHAIGLWTAGIIGSIGTTAGFSFSSGGLGLLLGGILSLPWMLAVAIAIWFNAAWIERHPFAFIATGMAVVCGSYALLGGAWLDAVAISSGTSSLCYLLHVAWTKHRAAKAG